MTQEFENKNPNETELQEPLPEPLERPTLPKVPFETIKSSHTMLISFRDGVREGTYQGKHLMSIAQGLMFLDNLINQSFDQLEQAKKAQKEAFNRTKETILQAGGTINGSKPN